MNTTTPQVPLAKSTIQDASSSIVVELINAKTFAKLLSISERTLYRLKSSGELPKPVILGGSVRWRLSVVRDWINEGCPIPKTLEI